MDLQRQLAFEMIMRRCFLRMIYEQGGQTSFPLDGLDKEFGMTWTVVDNPPRIMFTVISLDREKELLKNGADAT